MDLFNFQSILNQDKFIKEDIFQLSEVLNMQSGCEFFILVPKNFDFEEVDVTKIPNSDSIYEQHPWLEKFGTKRDKLDISLNIDLESPLDLCINIEESEISLELLSAILTKMCRSKSSKAILMGHLYRCIVN